MDVVPTPLQHICKCGSELGFIVDEEDSLGHSYPSELVSVERSIVNMHRAKQEGSEPDHVSVFSGLAARFVEAVDVFLFPPTCQVCGTEVRRSDTQICATCWAELGFISVTGCSRCGCPGVTEVAKCYNCADKIFHFSRLITAYSFEEGIQRLLHDLKYRGRTAVVSSLATGMVRRLEFLDIKRQPDRLLVPVPLHSSRERERGYNQSALIARVLSKAGFGQMSVKMVGRARATPTQTALDRDARKHNVEGAFELRGCSEGRNIWLIDDVVTTGASQK